jgi:predicted HTH transcriptional regulator
MLDELERQSRRISFDALPTYGVSLDEDEFLSFKTDYVKATGWAPVKDFRRKLGLTCTEAGRTYHVNAAVLLSASPERKRLFPYAKIECARFKGADTDTFLDQATIDAPIHRSVEPCIAFIKKNIALGSRIGEVYRQDRWEYPLAAIREAIINAIIHRDYAITGSDIKVAIFDDMLEVTSPGPLPDTMSPEELGTGRSEIRNRVLGPIFKDLKLIEGWGTGIKKMRTSLVEYPQIDLILNELGYSFQVQFKKKPMKKKSVSKPATDQVPTKYRPSTDQVPTKVRSSTGQVPDKSGLINFCRQPRSIMELMTFMQLKHRRTFVLNYLRPMMQEGLIAMAMPDKPRSSKQRYVLTAKGMAQVNKQK